MPLNIAALVKAQQDKLSESGLTPKHAAALRMSVFDAETVAKKFPTLPLHLGGFVIPYFDLKGHLTKFYRFRYTEDPERKGFAAVVTQKPFRYGQPAGTVNEIYLPPFAPWKQIAKEADTPIFITEGELKAACACANNIACMGLGGVWNFGAREKGLSLLPQFDDFVWEKRRVYVAYDSDAATNPQVMKAENALCRELTNRGAEPFIVRLPAIAELKKTGLDDYIVHNSAKDFVDLAVLNGEPYLAQQELHIMNTEVAYVRDPGIVLRYDNKQRLSVEAFTRHVYSNRFMIKPGPSGAPIKASVPKEWIAWPRRNEVKRITYVPGDPSLIVDRCINLWPGWGVEPKAGDVKLWHVLMDAFFEKDKDARTWFEQWFAYPLQNPGAKLMTAMVVWSRTQGNGKSTIGETMRRIYGDNYSQIDNTSLEGTFNEWADSKQFCMGDEITGNNRRAYADKLKNLVTQSLVYVNKKYLPTYSIPNCINYYFTSNHPDVIQLEDCDRRFFIHQVPEHTLDVEFFKKYYTWLDKEDGAAALFYYFVNKVSCKGFNPAAPAPITASKRQMLELGRSDLGSWVAALKESPDTVTVLGRGITDKKSLYTNEELRMFYDPDNRGKVTANGLAREMTRAGFKQVCKGQVVQVAEGKKIRLWAVRNIDVLLDMAGANVAKFYNKERQASAVTERIAKFAKERGAGA